MNSAEWLVGYMILWAVVSIFFLFTFIAWELIQLARRRRGNNSARTASQWVQKKAREGSRFWQKFIFWFPLIFGVYAVILIFASAWLLLGHWSGLCFNFGLLCEVDI